MKRRIWLSALGMVGLYIIAGLLLVQQWVLSTNTGSVHTGNPTLRAPAMQAQSPSVTTSYFTFELPAGFSVKRQNEIPNNDPQLQLLAATPSTTDEQFTVSYSQTPPAGLASAGDYNLRTSQPNIYTPFTPKDLPTGATAFRTIHAPAAFVVFWPHGSHYVELAASTDGIASLDQLQTVFSQAMHSWQWK